MSTIKVNKITSVNGVDSVEVDTDLKLKEQSGTPTSASHGALYVDTDQGEQKFWLSNIIACKAVALIINVG